MGKELEYSYPESAIRAHNAEFEDLKMALAITKGSRDAWVDESVNRMRIIQALRQSLQKWVEMFGQVVQPGTEGAELVEESRRALALEVGRPSLAQQGEKFTK
jgi:hypothetical protein